MERFWTYHATQEAALHYAVKFTNDGYFIRMTVNPPTEGWPHLSYWLEVVDDEFRQEHYRTEAEARQYHRFTKPVPGWFVDPGDEETNT